MAVDTYNSEESKFHSPVQSPDGDIKNFDLTKKVHYPNILLETDNLPFYRIKVLTNTLEKLEFIHEKVPEGYYDVYLKMGNQSMCLGMVHSHNLRALLQNSLYKDMKKTLRLSPTEYVEGNMMLAFCTSPLY